MFGYIRPISTDRQLSATKGYIWLLLPRRASDSTVGGLPFNPVILVDFDDTSEGRDLRTTIESVISTMPRVIGF